MYLTRRENGFRFQRRIPKNLEPILGKSPIRVPLGNLPGRDASRIARLLASNSDLLFQKITLEGCRTLPDNPDDPSNPDYNEVRKALISKLEILAIEDMKLTKHLLDVLGDDDQPQKLTPAQQLERSAFELSQARHEREKKTFHSESKANSERFIQEATAVKSELEHISKQVTGMREDITAVRESVNQSLEGGVAGPLTTDALEDWHHNIRLKEGINVKKTTTDYNRINDFIAFAGDQPVNKYKFDQFQTYAIMLAAVPSTGSVRAALACASVLSTVSLASVSKSDRIGSRLNSGRRLHGGCELLFMGKSVKFKQPGYGFADQSSWGPKKTRFPKNTGHIDLCSPSRLLISNLIIEMV